MLQSVNISNDIYQSTNKQKLKSIIKSTAKVSYLLDGIYTKQYAGKTETMFNIRLNNHRNLNPIIACRHFQQKGHNFNSHTKFLIIDKVVNTSSSKDIFCERLIQ